MQAIALEIGFSETVFVLPPASGGTVRIRIFTPYSSFPSPATPSSAPRSSSARRCSWGEIVLETGRGQHPGRDSSATRAVGSSSGGWRSRCRRCSRSPTTAGFRGASASRARSCRSSCTTTAPTFVFVGIRSEAGRRRCSRTRRRSRRSGTPASVCFAGSGETVDGAHVLGGGEDPATGSAAGPLACHLARHGRIALGRRDHDLAGRRDRPAVDALRARRRRRRADRPRRGRRTGGHGRPRRVRL